MAKVPYQPFSTEQPISGTGASGVSVRAPEEAFGTNVANAIAHAGTMVEGAGNELFNRAIAMKQLDNEAEARMITNDAELSLANLRVGYGNKQGYEAKEGLTAYQEAVKGVYQDAKGRASNQAVQRMVDGQTASAMRSSIFAGATHAAAEGKKWQVSTLTNRIDSYKNRLLTEPENENLWNEASTEMGKIVGQLNDFQGEPPGSDNRKHDLAAAMSDLYSTRIKGMSAKDPERAARLLEENKAFILGQDQDKIDALVTNRLQTQLSAKLSHSVNSGFAPYMDPSHILRFNGVDERLTRVFQRAQWLADQEGVRFTIGDKGGLRTPEEQRDLVRARFSRTMFSNHLTGRAMDVVPLGPDGKPNYNDKEAYSKIEGFMFQAAKELGIELGPEHAQISSWDPGHYSLPRGSETGPVTTYKALTEKEKVDWAKKYYSELRPGDDVGLIKVENAVMGQHRKFEAMETDQKRKDKETVNEALLLDPDNQPYTVQDLLARGDKVEGLEDSWERLQKSDPAWVLRMQNTMRSARITRDNEQEYNRLQGLADNHPEQFLDENTEANDKLTFASRKHFDAEKRRLRKGDENPEVRRAIGWMQKYAGLSDMMTEQGIFSRDPKNPDAYDTFTGAMHEAIASWTKAHKGLSPTQEQVLKEIGPMVLRNRIISPGWLPELPSRGIFPQDPFSAALNWMFGPQAYNVMNQVIPSDKRDKAKEEFMNEHGYEPSDKEIWRTHVRTQFDELYGAPKEGPKPVKTVPITREASK